jgi:hypothetical protein
MDLSGIKVLYRDENCQLWGIPYGMREDVGQGPKDIDRKYRGAWIWLGGPGWWAHYSKEEQGQICTFLDSHDVPGNFHEWSRI